MEQTSSEENPAIIMLAELLAQVFWKISNSQKANLFISAIDFKEQLGRIDVVEETSRNWLAAIGVGKATGHYWFRRHASS